MSMYYPNAQDMRRISNSNAKTLIQNWVEERSVQKYDQIPEEYLNSDKAAIKYFKEGHRGLLTTDEHSPSLKHTTYKKDYIQINTYDPNDESKGIRYKLTEQAVRRQLMEEAERNQTNKYGYSDEPTNYLSEAKDRFTVEGFVHRPPQPTTKHDLYAEMPVSYWTEQKNKAHGVTQFKTLDSPFRRNAAFTTPGSESYCEAKPGELENYPYMSQNGHNNAAIN